MSGLLVEHMRREGRGTQLPASERLHSDAESLRRRREDRQTRVEIAARYRANPSLIASSRSLSRDRGNVSERLYKQAILSREHATDLARLERAAPRGATFHPRITKRSVLLANRRRGKAWSGGGAGNGRGLSDSSEASRSTRGLAVEEALLAEGAMYNRRRQERQARREELGEASRRSPRANRQSKRLLKEAESRCIADRERRHLHPQQHCLGNDHGVSQVGEKPGGGSGDDRSQSDFNPKLEGLQTSERLLLTR